MFEVGAKWMLWIGYNIDIGSDTELLLRFLDPPCKLGTGICELRNFGRTDISCA